MLVGRSKADAPEIDGKVYLSTDRPLRPGQIVTARVIQASDYDLNAEVMLGAAHGAPPPRLVWISCAGRRSAGAFADG